DWAGRPLFFYWNRRYPELYNNIALQKGPYKLAGHTNYNPTISSFELFNILQDPYEQNNLVDENPEMAKALKGQLDSIYSELINSENIKNQPRIGVGSEYENPVFLNRNDAGGDRGIWAQEDVYGKWRVDISEGNYDITFKFIEPVKTGGQMVLETGAVIHQFKNTDKSDYIVMENVYLPAMECDIIPFYQVKQKRILPFWVKLDKKD
ncbi:MAG TPA: hypothetical protein VKA10_00105, partial [Prolixibacteraceae bacterium]|nr:hypothetical protein [Prolixibacteraceae bacterium]